MSPETRTQAILGSAIMLRHRLRQCGEVSVSERYREAVSCARQHGLEIPDGTSLENPHPEALAIIERLQAQVAAA